MDILGGAFAQIWNLLGYVGPFLFVLGLVIFVHEYGHYIVGRWCGVGVDAFSIGFGPRLFGWKDKHGTDWKLSAIPLGGYVKFRGDMNAASVPDPSAAEQLSAKDREEAFQFKPVWKRAAIVAAGPIANFILALAIFTAILMVYGRYDIQPVIDRVVEGSPAAKAGLEPGDRVISINGKPVQVFDDVRSAIVDSETDALKFEIERKGKITDIVVNAPVAEHRTRFGVHRVRMAGISSSALPEHRKHVQVGPIDAVEGAAGQVVGVISQSARFLGRLVAGREHADQLSGPIRIAQVSGKVAESGFVSLLSLAAIVSISIGFLNLLPVPLLDGGHLMFYAYEAVLGRPLSARSQDVFFRIGFALVLGLMAFSVVNDLVQLSK